MPNPFSNDRPDKSPAAVWQLQNMLLDKAQELLGPRIDKKIYQPTFSDKGANIINTPNMDGAFAVLSLNAAGYWPTTVYELAHETVHLLDPVRGCTNYLEEGVAVAFSVEMSHSLAGRRIEPTLAVYIEAWGWCSSCRKTCTSPQEMFEAISCLSAKRHLRASGFCSQITPDDLLQRLTARCPGRGQ